MKRVDKLVSNLQSIASSALSTSHPSSTGNPVSNSLSSERSLDDEVKSCKEDFEKAMCDDLNTPRAIAALFRLVSLAEKAINKSFAMSKENAELILKIISEMDSVFGVLYEVPTEYFQKKSYGEGVNSSLSSSGTSCEDCGGNHSNQRKSLEETLLQVRELAEQRREFKSNKQFKEADQIRNRIAELGYGVKDTKEGFEVFLL